MSIISNVVGYLLVASANITKLGYKGGVTASVLPHPPSSPGLLTQACPYASRRELARSRLWVLLVARRRREKTHSAMVTMAGSTVAREEAGMPHPQGR